MSFLREVLSEWICFGFVCFVLLSSDFLAAELDLGGEGDMPKALPVLSAHLLLLGWGPGTGGRE